MSGGSRRRRTDVSIRCGAGRGIAWEMTMLLLAMGMTGTFAQMAAEKAVETLLRDVDEMVVNERLGCCVEWDATDTGRYGFGFDEMWFVGTAGNQDDDMPYEYFHYYVKERTVTNELGTPYVRFALCRGRMIMSVGDKNGVYVLAPGQARWWEKMTQLAHLIWDEQVLLENVVRFDIYYWGWNGDYWADFLGSNYGFDSTRNHYGYQLGSLANVPPAAFEFIVQVTSPEAALEGGMALAASPGTGQEEAARELMVRDATTYSVRAEPITGAAQVRQPENHYLD